MANVSDKQSGTFIEAVKDSLAAAGRYNSGDSLPPAAILWTDADGEWRPIAARLRTLLPELLMLGEYEPEQRTGPSIWLRCIVDGALPDVKLPEKSIPILYLPNVSRQYTHGGLSPQECVTPDLTFRSAIEGKAVAVKIESVQWLGLRCRVVIAPATESLFTDLRTKPNDPKTSITQMKPFDKDGKAGLLVEDENLAGSATSVVVFDATGRVFCKQPTMVGGDE